MRIETEKITAGGQAGLLSQGSRVKKNDQVHSRIWRLIVVYGA